MSDLPVTNAAALDAPTVPNAASSVDPIVAPLDVETTNWNAIKIIAVQHGISSDVLQQLRDAFAEPAKVDSSRDFGHGTPFCITTSRLGSGRLVYRFRARQHADLHSSQVDDDDCPQQFMPRSSSSGAIYTHSNTRDRIQPETVAGSSLQTKGGLGASFSRITGNKSLKQSKSIPVLRRKPKPDSDPPKLITSGITFPTAQNPSSTTLDLSNSRQQRFDDDSSPSSSSIEQAKSMPTGRKASGSIKSSLPTRHVVGRLEEGDVLGAVLGLRHEEVWSSERAPSSRLFTAHDGPSQQRLQLSPRKSSARSSLDDVQECASLDSVQYQSPAFGADLHFHQQPASLHSNKRKSGGASSNPPSNAFADSSRLLPELDMGNTFAKSPRLYQLREAASFDSTTSDLTARAQYQHSIEYFPPELRPIIVASEDNKVGLPDTLVYDVMQYYERPVAPGSSFACIDSNSPREPGAQNTSYHRRRNSATLNSPVPSNASADAQKHQVSQAQDLPTSAAPGDDPRFSVWAVRNETQDGSFVFSNRKGETAGPGNNSIPLDSPHSSTQGQRAFLSGSAAGISGDNYNVTSSRESVNSGRTRTSSQNTAVSSSPQKAHLLAASATRLVAELTAEIDQPFLIDFFYTYRSFIDPSDLLTLLTLRFEWAISDASSAEDEARRRIVRVRSYVVIKYWLLHHFEHDFLPRRALRQRLATWLNSMAKDPRVTSRAADFSIINSLRKVVRGLKETYSHSGVGGLLLHDPGRVTTDVQLQANKDSLLAKEPPSQHSEQPSGLLENVYVSEQELGSEPAATAEDINLDFMEDRRSQSSQPPQQTSLSSNQKQSDVDAAHAGQKAVVETGILVPRQTSAATVLPARTTPTVSSSTQAGPASPPAPMPSPSSALSRAFVQTVGRLSRFKRILGSRGLGADGNNEFDLDTGEFQDLLFVKGGLESLIEYFEVDRFRKDSFTKISAQEFHRPATLKEEEEGDEEDPRSQMSGDSTGREETPSLVGADSIRSTPASSIDLTAHAGKHLATNGLGIAPETDDAGAESLRPTQDGLDLEFGFLTPIEGDRQLAKGPEPLHHMASEQTLRSVSPIPTASQEVKMQEAPRRMSLTSIRSGARSFQQAFRGSVTGHDRPNIVQIDDIDLSSDEDDFAVRRALRRLPGARDLRHAKTIRDLNSDAAAPRSSMDSQASSMYQGNFETIAKPTKRSKIGSFGGGHGRSVSVDSITMRLVQQEPFKVGTVHTEMLDPDEALQGYELVKGFKLDDIESDEEEEAGGVEAALRRLEGIIDSDRQKERAKRVERLWQRSLARNAKSDRQSIARSESDQKRSSNAGRPASSSHTGGSLADNEDGSTTASIDLAECMANRQKEEGAVQPTSGASDKATSFLDLQHSAPLSEADGHEEVREAQIGASATAPLKSAASGAILGQRAKADTLSREHAMPQMPLPTRRRASVHGVNLSPSPKMQPRPLLPVHRSFLLSFRSETVARQMCLIEAELLRSVTWDELASTRWKEHKCISEVNDWETFYRDRVRDRVEAQRIGQAYQERSVEAIVSRFNLTSNWVASEVVLTQNIDERVAVICKLIRVAWKCYLQSNFASLTQIIFGLSTPWVERLRRTWNRVGYYEMRIWKDLNSFVGPRNNFRHLRNAMLQLVDASAGMGNDSSADPAQTETVRECIPFFGLYLSDLMVNDSLPTFVDPSMPTTPASPPSRNENGVVVPFQPCAPDAFTSLPPLPDNVPLEPLINVIKFRNTANMIKLVASFQHAARHYTFEADKSAYVRCLKLRCLSGELMARLSHLIEP